MARISSRAATLATLVFNLTSINFENSVFRPNGNLLLTSADNGTLYEINPTSPSPELKLVTTFGGASIFGINTIGVDKYAIVGGVSQGAGAFTNESVYTVDFSTNNTNPVANVAITIPGASLLDGVVGLPGHSDVVLVSDAKQGYIYRVSLVTGSYAIAATGTALAGNSGVNGLKVLNGYVYYTNTARRTYGKFPITEQGVQSGKIEIIATNASSDDFALDGNGVAYLGRQQSPSAVVRIQPNGTKTIIATNPLMGRPCSLDLAADGTKGYVTTANGQIFRFEIPA